MINKIFSYIAILFLLLFALFSFNFSETISQQTALYICVPGAFVLTFFATKNYKPSTCFKFLMAVYVWECITYLSAEDQSVALDELKRLLACFMLAFSFFYLGKKKELVPWLYLVYIVYYLGIVYYANTSILNEEFDYTEDRLGDRILNANLIAYVTFFVTFVIYVFPNFSTREWLKRFFRILFILSPAWSFVVGILTGSRQVLVIQFPFIALLLYLRYFRHTRVFTQIVSLIVVVVFVAVVWDKVDSIYEQSNLNTRMEMELEEDARIIHYQRAVKIGLDNPITGVGPGNYKLYAPNRISFSHSSYSELFANNGFPGLLLFLLMFYYFCKQQWRRYRKTHDELFLYFLVFGLFFTIDNAFYVMHTAPWLISFFILVDSHSATYYKISRYKLKPNE